MDSLNFVKLKLLTESKKILDAVQEQRWDLYPALNNSFQELLKESAEKHGSQLDDIAAQLFEDNEKVILKISELQSQATEERNSLISSSKALKAYLKDSV